MSNYVKTFKHGDEDKGKNKNNKLMPFHIDNDKSINSFGLRLKTCKILN